MAFVVDSSSRARLFLRGKDARAFVHRLSTQHTNSLAPGEARLSCFTTDKGRIKDVAHVVVVDDGLWLIGHGNLPTAELAAWLDRYLFSEDVVLEDHGDDRGAVDVDAATASACCGEDVSALSPWAAVVAGDCVVVRGFDVDDGAGSLVSRFVVVAPPATLPAPTLARADFDARQIAAGVPTTEVGEAVTPLDLGLHDAIHWAKGCYIGQEVIARLDTYGKQRKQLVGVVTSGDVHVGDAIQSADSAISGAVTSVGTAAWAGRSRALAIVKGDIGGGVDVDVAGHAGRLVPRAVAQAPHD